jgi:site-specific recombinase XerC
VSNAVLKRFLKDTSITNISEFTKQRAEAFILDDSVVMRTRRDRLDQLFNWAKYLVGKNYLQHNFVADIERPKVKHTGKPTTLKAEQVLKLLQVAAKDPVGDDRVVGGMLPFFAIAALSGLRPEEAQRLEPDWEWYSKENALITNFKAKINVRSVEISPELIEILDYCRAKGLHPSAYTVRGFNRIRKVAGVFDKWDNDILRRKVEIHP